MVWHRKLGLFFQLNWLKAVLISVGSVMLTLIAVGTYCFITLESFYKKMMMAQAPVSIFIGAIHATIFIGGYLFFLRGGMSSMKTSPVLGKKINVPFSDVLGIDEAKHEAWEVVELLKDRKKLQAIGGNVLRGLLMVGPPGCGKTMLAKAIATEANIPFIAMAASGFTEVFVGVGASRVRKLFKKARVYARAYGACIIFIDELDAIGRQRSFSFFGGGGETNATQNQLLSEMDGLTSRQEDIVVVGATNTAERHLDDALLRPGRFDRKIYIDKPDCEGREKLLRHYLGKVKYDKAIDTGRLARRCVYKSPAEIESIVKEAALIAARKNLEGVTYKEVSEAVERVDMGLKRRRKMTPDERRMVAYHEAGHAIALYILHPTDDVFKATIITHRDALGMVARQPREELFTRNKKRLLADIKVSLSGYAAEKIKTGTTSDGVSSDFQHATVIAHAMVWQLGMGPKGYVGNYTMDPGSRFGDLTMSDKFKEDFDTQTQQILQESLSEVEELLKKQDKVLDRFADELLKKEELEYDEIEAIFKEFGILQEGLDNKNNQREK